MIKYLLQAFQYLSIKPYIQYINKYTNTTFRNLWKEFYIGIYDIILKKFYLNGIIRELKISLIINKELLTPMDCFKIGIIGLGRVAHRYADAFKDLDNIKLQGVFSKNKLTTKRFSKTYEKDFSIKSNETIESFFDSDLDAVIITTPDLHHQQYAIMAAKNKKHILIEKPICTEIKDAEEIIEAVNSSQVTCGIGYHLRWHDGFRKLAGYLHSDFSGEIYHIDIAWGHKFVAEAKWRNSRTTSKWWSLTTLGTHLVDIARWYLLPLCGEVIESRPITTNKQFHETDETSFISMKFTSGATASIYSSVLNNHPLTLKIYTSNGIIFCNNLINPTNSGNVIIGNDEILFNNQNNPYAQEIKNLHTCSIQGKQAEVSAIEGLNNIKCLLGF